MNITAETRADGLAHARAHLTPRMLLIIGTLRDGPKTAAEVADKLGFRDMNAVRPRLHELEKMAVVRVIGKRSNPRSGISNAVYELIEKAAPGDGNTGGGSMGNNTVIKIAREAEKCQP